MALETPLWLQAGSYAARLDRMSFRQQHFEGVVRGLKVSERGAGANLTVDVAAGEAIVDGDDQADQGAYRIRSTAVENVTGFVAATSTQRIDRVVLRVNDPNAGGPAGDNATIVRIAGTESGTPTPPAVPATAIPLAQVGPFTTSTVSITNSMITDERPWSAPVQPAGTYLESASQRRFTGFLVCDGLAISRTTYAELFDAIQVTHGVGDGSSTFNKPDGRGRSGVGVASMGDNGTATGNARIAATLGGTGGEAAHTLTNAESAAHTHAQFTGNANTDHTHPIDHDHPSASVTPGTLIGQAPPNDYGSPGAGTTLSLETVTVDIPPFTGTSGGQSTTHYHPILSDGGGGAHNVTHPYQGRWVHICIGR